MNLPFLPYRGFVSLVGPELAAEADRHLARPGIEGLVLLSDAPGRRLALLPVGKAEPHMHFEDVLEVDIDGVRACCGLRVADIRAAQHKIGLEQRLAQREAALVEREWKATETEARLAEIVRTLAERDINLAPAE
jgi:hypothetical protein